VSNWEEPEQIVAVVGEILPVGGDACVTVTVFDAVPEQLPLKILAVYMPGVVTV